MKGQSVGRRTETRATLLEDNDAWMERRIRYFGKPCMTTQEYRAVVFSLYGIPEFKWKQGDDQVEIPLELPSQRFVASKMTLTESRVSQLLDHAAKALLWFEEQHTPDVGWIELPRGRGIEKWHFRAPVLDRPIPPEPTHKIAKVEIHKRHGIYRLAFAGEL